MASGTLKIRFIQVLRHPNAKVIHWNNCCMIIMFAGRGVAFDVHKHFFGVTQIIFVRCRRCSRVLFKRNIRYFLNNYLVVYTFETNLITRQINQRCSWNQTIRIGLHRCHDNIYGICADNKFRSIVMDATHPTLFCLRWHTDHEHYSRHIATPFVNQLIVVILTLFQNHSRRGF